MISTLLVEHSALVPVSLMLVAAVCVTVGWTLLRTRPGDRRPHWVLTGLSLVPVAALTLSPTSRRAFETCAVDWSIPTPGAVESLANLALFLPAVFFAVLATRRPLPVLAAGVGLSAAIEAVQAAVPALGRSCDTQDWAMNTAGTVVAVLLAAATTALTDRRAPRTAVTRGR